MGIESLQNAARAAGFAMAADEPLLEAAHTETVEPWSPIAALPPAEQPIESAVDKAQATFTEWVKGVVGTTGRRATA